MYEFALKLLAFYLVGFLSRFPNQALELKQELVQDDLKKYYSEQKFSNFEASSHLPMTVNSTTEELKTAKPWQSVLVMNKTDMCTETYKNNTSTAGNEDCLYIYAAIPKKFLDRSGDFDLVIHVHNGSSLTVSPRAVLPEYSVDRNVILVSFNHRLGPAGFLTTEDDVPHTSGRQNQPRVVKTVQNINKTPSSVQYHYLSPITNDSYDTGHVDTSFVSHKAPFTHIRLQKVTTFAKDVGCHPDENQKIVDCLQGLVHENLNNKTFWFKRNLTREGIDFSSTENPYILSGKEPEEDVATIATNLINGSKCHLKNPCVKLKQGVVQGTLKESYGGRKFSSFEGIPYAKPPINDLRFQEPIAAEGWDDVLIANKTYMCSQMSNDNSMLLGTEDCLYIYVYVPRENINRSENFDVIVHIHGGSLTTGSPSTWGLPDYLMDRDVIYVAFNYRLGPPGFLSTGDEVVPGNNGMKDQNLALRWIQKNIKAFGGNPNSVTLTGFSSGSSSVQFHYLSPVSKGLFHKVYAASLAVTNPAAFTPDPRKNTISLAKNLNCPIGNSKSLVECLKALPVEKLVNTSIWFRAVIEKAGSKPFMTKSPCELLKESKVYKGPIVVSNSIYEASYLLDDLYKNETNINDICKNWNDWTDKYIDLDDFMPFDFVQSTTLKLKDFYLNNCSDITYESGLKNLGRLLSDFYFLYGADISLRLQAAAGTSKLFYFLYNYTTEDKLDFGGPRVPSHVTDMKLIFKFDDNPSKLKPNDKKMMRILTEFLANYARDGVPKLGCTVWKPIDITNPGLDILQINGPNEIYMRNVKELAPRKFWKSLPINIHKC